MAWPGLIKKYRNVMDFKIINDDTLNSINEIFRQETKGEGEFYITLNQQPADVAFHITKLVSQIKTRKSRSHPLNCFAHASTKKHYDMIMIILKNKYNFYFQYS